MTTLHNSQVWCVYILKRDDNGRLYTGITSDLKRRLKQHGKRAGAKCLRRQIGNLQLVYYSASAYDYKTAARMEYNLKRKRGKHFKLHLIKTKPLFLDRYLLANKS
ncbi:ORF-63 [Catopsilia pomona nucleopolyhedrovirus]|uniref:ORF-63 n=1 Tax=Catopsilia pomona nucleopolyhedrovirus TaxID=1850906 RepID=A0A172WZD6_9ABAC|nr:ORF-63 [Catopsilia pomona nucleopolyhedrovirus]ANF29711.1 ORF-63 [Catopsilia pomona nucleopolyhedrovirus]